MKTASKEITMRKQLTFLLVLLLCGNCISKNTKRFERNCQEIGTKRKTKCKNQVLFATEIEFHYRARACLEIAHFD